MHKTRFGVLTQKLLNIKIKEHKKDRRKYKSDGNCIGKHIRRQPGKENKPNTMQRKKIKDNEMKMKSKIKHYNNYD